MIFPGGSHLISDGFLVNQVEISDISFRFTRDGVAPAPDIATSRGRTLCGCVDNNIIRLKQS